MKIRQAKNTDIELLSELFNGYRVFSREDSDVDAGFVQLFLLFSSTRMKKLWLLNDLFVTSDYRGKGISVKLIERAKKLVTDSAACAMFLETEKSNIIGNNLYHKTGFEQNEGSNFYEWYNE